MPNYRLLFTTLAQKDAKKLSQTGLRQKAEELLEIPEQDPFQTPPHYEKLVGNLSGAYSRRINIRHRIADLIPRIRFNIAFAWSRLGSRF